MTTDSIDHRIIAAVRKAHRISRYDIGRKFAGLSAEELDGRLETLASSGAIVVVRGGQRRGPPGTMIMVSHDAKLQPTTMPPRKFEEVFDDMRKKHGVLGILELQGLVAESIAEGVRLERADNPSLADALTISRLLQQRRMVRVLPYQIRMARDTEEEIDQLRGDGTFSAFSSSTAVYARLASYGFETSILAVRKALGMPPSDAMAMGAE